MAAKSKIEREMEAHLESLGVPYRIAQGKNHHKIYVGDRLAGVLSRGNKSAPDPRNFLNLKSALTRAAKGMQHATAA